MKIIHASEPEGSEENPEGGMLRRLSEGGNGERPFICSGCARCIEELERARDAREIADHLKVKERAIEDMARDGKIPFSFVGRARRFSLNVARAAVGLAPIVITVRLMISPVNI